MQKHWWHKATIYQIYPKSFMDKTGEWDTAGAAILLAEINGMIFDPHYQPLTYNRRESLINPPFVMVADNTQNWASVFQFN